MTVVKVEYLIVPDGAKWKIKLGKIEYPPYDALEQAIAAAIDAASIVESSSCERLPRELEVLWLRTRG